MTKRKAQVTVEFIIITVSIMSVLVGMFFIVNHRDHDLTHVKQTLEIKSIGENIAGKINELIISGYNSESYTFVPDTLKDGTEIKINVYPENRMVEMLWRESRYTVPILTSNVAGNIAGDNSSIVSIIPGKVLFKNKLGQIQITQEGGFQESCEGNVANWHFDHTFQDTSGNQNHLQSVGDVFISSDAKYGFGSAYFDGAGDYLHIPNNPTIDFEVNSEYTISYWVKLKTLPPSFYATVMKSSFSLSYGHLIRTESELLVYTDDDSSVEQNVAGFFLERENEWVHVVQTFNNRESCVYKDSKLVECQDNLDLTSSSGDLFIGSNSGSGYYLEGWLDEVKMWNRSLSADEILLEFLNDGCK